MGFPNIYSKRMKEYLMKISDTVTQKWMPSMFILTVSQAQACKPFLDAHSLCLVMYKERAHSEWSLQQSADYLE